MGKSVTEQVAEWVVGAKFADVPEIGLVRGKERVLDSVGAQVAGMGVLTGHRISTWVKAQEAKPESTVIGGGFKSTASLAALANATAGHALEIDDAASFAGHYSNPLTAAGLALGERLGSSGEDMLLAWLVGYEIIAQSNKPCAPWGHEDGSGGVSDGHGMLQRGWHNQGFQTALGVAAQASKLMGFDVHQTRMALGNAASTMAGFHKNRGSDTKPFHAGNPAMHGIMASELVAVGFTANEDIFDGHLGVARLLGLELGDAEKVLDGLGTWEVAVNGSLIKEYASCGAAHTGVRALDRILKDRPVAPDDVASIDIYLSEFLTTMKPYHLPQTGLEGKFSIEYDLATMLLDRSAFLPSYTDEMVHRPQAQELMQRIHVVAEPGKVGGAQAANAENRLVLTLTSGEKLELTVTWIHGTIQDPLTKEELEAKFHTCAANVPEIQRREIARMCWDLENVENVTAIADCLGAVA